MRQDEPQSGWYAAIRAPKDKLPADSLRVDVNDHKLLTTDGTPLRDYPYLVIEVMQNPTREDWFKIPDLLQAHAAIQSAYRAGDTTEVDAAVAAFGRAAHSSDDLIPGDAARLVEKLNTRYAQVQPPQPAHLRQRREVPSFPSLESLNLYR